MLHDPQVFACLMFGRGRFQNGILIQPKEGFDPRDEVKLEEYRNKIWFVARLIICLGMSLIEEPQAFHREDERFRAVSFSHLQGGTLLTAMMRCRHKLNIWLQMIMVTDPSKPLEYTAKGTPRRQVCIKAYTEEIDALYKRVEESSQVDLPPPRNWNPTTVRQFVQDVVKQVTKNDAIKADDDLFLQGCDSLQATWIRNSIIHALRSSSSVNTHDISPGFVYAHPSIAALAAYLSSLFAGKIVDKDAEHAAGIGRMVALLDKYSAGLERHFPEKAANGHANGVASEVVLVTGTTGRLGCHLLSQLLERPEVVHVYALNRESSGSVEALEKRSREAFKQWCLDESLLSSGKVSFHAVDLAKPQFGLSRALYDEVRSSLVLCGTSPDSEASTDEDQRDPDHSQR